jgi:hypothetical protein
MERRGDELMPPYRRIPLVRDLEYIVAFLRGLDKGGMHGAETAVKQVMLEFEKEKDHAVGLGKRIDETKLHLRSLVSECMRMCKEIGIVRKDTLSIRIEDPEVRTLMTEGLRNPACRITLIKRLLSTYSSFGEVLFKVRATPSGKIYASHDREKEKFAKSIERYDIDVSQWTFEAARDLATQLGLLNWRMLSQHELEQDPLLGGTGYVVYLVSIIAKLSELQSANMAQLSEGFEAFCIRSSYEQIMEKGAPYEAIFQKAKEKGYLIIDYQSDCLFLKELEVDEKKFEEALWREYLKLSGYVPREPVYYSILRDRACEILQISDKLFDSMIHKMLRNPGSYEVKVSAGSGTFPLEFVTSRKHIPPKLVSDIYMAYLLIERLRRK